MSDWKPYAVQATLQTMPLLVRSCTRGYRWRLSTHGTPGTKGDAKRKHGRESIVDQVACLLTVPEVAQLVALADREDPLLWTHPLLPPINGHIENLDIPAENSVYGYFVASFQVVEAFDRQVTQTRQPGTGSAAAAQAKAGALFADWLADYDDLDTIPTDNKGADFTTAASGLTTAFASVDGVFNDLADPIGDSSWRDLSRSLDTFTATVDTFVDAAREIESDLGVAAYSLQSAPLLIRETIADAVEALKTPAQTVASFVTTEPADLFSMMMEAGIDVTEDAVVSLMEDNNLPDPFNIPAGSVVAIPVV